MPSKSWEAYLVPHPERLKPRRHRGSLISYGPSELRLRETIVYEGSPDHFIDRNPQLFATGTTSRDEGYAYWALLKIIGTEREIGKNGMTWYYQSKVGGGSNRAGGAVVDFVVEGLGRNNDIGIRIVTPYFHEKAGSFKRATDAEQLFMLLDQGIDVADVNSRNYVLDPTGVAVLQIISKAIERRPDFNITMRRWK